MNAERKLKDLAGIGPAMLKDFEVLGIRSVAHLADSEADELYERLCRVTGLRHDICCLDVFHCAVAQARDRNLPPEQLNWWYWSRQRKALTSSGPKMNTDARRCKIV